ncbi:MAG: hypothetical protein ACM3NP_11535 [Actinomycetota bacterium]
MPFFTGCHDEKLKINYELGIFPDSVMAVQGLNTEYDDYNIDIEAARLTAVRPVVFSSNRQSSGGEFDLTHGVIWYTFGQTTGFFQLDGSMEEDNFLDRLTSVFNTDANEFGPFRFFNSRNGLEYMVVSTQTAENGLDLVYGRYIPVYSSLPVVEGPVATTVFNSSFNDAYLSLSTTLDTAYFCSDRGGNFDIYMMTRPLLINLDDWFTSSPAVPLPVDSINSGYDEKCPFVRGKYLVFASEMPGGHGGFDLWYSVFRDGKWGSPVNLGPEINSAANEYRPVLGTDLRFENNFLMFSSDRSGGRGGYDLYLTGITLPR